MPNLIEQAAQCEHRDFAASLLATALKIEDRETCDLWLPEQDAWVKLTPALRAARLGDWLYSEAFRLMDIAPSMPKAVVGTND